MPLQPRALFGALCLTFVFMTLSACASTPQTPDELRAFFNTPFALLGIMLLASLGSAAKQLVVARRQNAGITLKEYFLKIETLIMLGHNAAAWLALLNTDTLNLASALGAGYVANDAADAWTKKGRSGELTDSKTTTPKE